MSVEAILTVVTVLLAVVALIPPERAEDLRVRIGIGGRLLGVLAACLVVYWALIEEIHSSWLVRELPRPFNWPVPWTPASASLGIVLAAAALGYWSYRRKLPVARVPELAKAIANALARRRYVECIHLVETHLDTVLRAHRGDYWRARLRIRYLPTLGEQYRIALASSETVEESNQRAASEQAEGPEMPSPVSRIDLPMRIEALPKPRPIVTALKSWTDRSQESAQDLIRSISLSPALVEEIASANPYLGVAILQAESTWIYREFAEEYARSLVAYADSILYRELRRAQNIDSGGMICIDPYEQPLLNFLCNDAVRSDGPKVLYTFLDVGVDSIRSGSDGSLKALLNGPIGNFYERGRWSTPPFVTVYLLEIVAPRIATNPQAPLINLYLARTFVTELLHQLNPSDDVDDFREWPTPTHYLLYATVSAVRDIVLILKDRPETLDAVRAARTTQRGPHTLPDHAIDVLGAVLYECLRSEKLSVHFKSYLLEVWWRAYSDKYHGNWAESAKVLEALARGGAQIGGDMRHRSGVRDALSQVDMMIQVSTAADDLRARLEL